MRPDESESKHPEAGDIVSRELVATRIIAAPRERVWEAWTDPVLLARWWGPDGFTNTFEEFDPKPGGHWRFVMHGPNGTGYRNHSVFIELTRPERIVFDHVSGHHFVLTATFEETAGRTRIIFRQRFDTAAECERIKVFAADANEQNLDRLEAVLGLR